MIPEQDKQRHLEDIRAIITSVNPTAQIVESTYSTVDLDFLIDKNPV
jgi:hypothetical protein